MKKIWRTSLNCNDFRKISDNVSVADIYVPKTNKTTFLNALANQSEIIFAFIIDMNGFDENDPAYVSRKIVKVDNGDEFTLTPMFDAELKRRMSPDYRADNGEMKIKQEPLKNEYEIIHYDFVMNAVFLLEIR